MQIDYNYSDNLALLCPALGFGSGGGGCAYAGAAARAGANSAKKVKDTIYNTSITSVQANLKEKGVAFYKGVPVCMTELPFEGSAFSFGIIVMDDYYEDVSSSDFARTLNHEYGHTKHMQQIGPSAYAITVAVPSLIFAGISNANFSGVSQFISDNYYNLPWERTADYLGGVNRGYATGANAAGTLYWAFTIWAGFTIP